MEKTDKMQLIEERTGKSIRAYLQELYLDKNLPFTEIQKVIKKDTGVHVAQGLLSIWFDKIGIKANKKKKLNV